MMRGSHLPWQSPFRARSLTLDDGTRFDAIGTLSNGEVIIGARNNSPGDVYVSSGGITAFTKTASLEDAPFINSIEVDTDGTVYLLAGTTGELWKSSDNGQTFTSLGVFSSGGTTRSIRAYGLGITPAHTIVTCDTTTGGGRIFRRPADSESYSEVTTPADNALYRIIDAGDRLLVDGWAGKMYKSMHDDDGDDWTLAASVSSDYLFGLAYLGNGVVLVGDAAGKVFRSEDHGDTFTLAAIFPGAIDDIKSLGSGRAIVSTYTASMDNFLTENYGKSFYSLGRPPSPDAGDWIDRMTYVEIGGQPAIVGTTNQGHVVVMQYLTH